MKRGGNGAVRKKQNIYCQTVVNTTEKNKAGKRERRVLALQFKRGGSGQDLLKEMRASVM